MLSYDRRQDQINVWMVWVIAMTAACTVGWASGEFLGRAVLRTYGWTLGHLVGWATFELFIWTLRWHILRRISTVPLWRRLDTLIWFSAEIVAWALGEGIHQLTPTVWVTASAVWGVVGGASIWFILVCARQARPGRFFVLTGAMYGLLGFIGGIVFLSLMMTMTEDVRQMAEHMAVPEIGWLIGGALVGAGTGAMTGLAIARLWLRPLTSD